MRRIVVVIGLAGIAIACSETVGGIMQDAGDMLSDAGDMMQPDAGAQDTPVECNKSEQNPDLETKFIYHWAEFEVSPGVTDVTTCHRYAADNAPPHRNGVFCWRGKANWKQGTTMGIVTCGYETDDGWSNKPESITVHN